MSDDSTAIDDRLRDTPPLAKLLGRTVLAASASEGVHLRFTPGPEFCNRFGTVQGGILGAMLDAALGLSVLVSLPKNSHPVTVSMTAHYYKAAKPGAIEARGRVQHRSKTLAHAEADLYDAEGTRLAHALGTLRILTE